MMASSPVISVPRKVTSDVDFKPAISSFIGQTYGELPDRYSEEIATLNRTRQDAVGGTAGSDATARDLLYRYFGQLELFELRFPDIRVSFNWNDAFNPGKSISQSSLAYEKASVIFNIAATLSSLASAQNRGSPDGLKRSFNYYRSAAGMFTYINENFLHAPSQDLGKDLIKLLVALMTAQATEVFLERMNEEKKSPGLKSKIAYQLSQNYAGMQEEIKEHVTKAIFDRAWLVLIQTKARYFVAVAQHNRALADSAASKHGDALARLTMADMAAKDAQRLAMTYGSSFYIAGSASAASTLPADAANNLQEMCKALVSLVSEARSTAQKDNDLIYHALVPSESSLPVIDKAANIAEPTPIQEIYAAPEVQKLVGTDIFIKLVPLSVIESSSLYSEEKAKILRSEGERCEIADGEFTTALEHLGLPGSLDKFRDTVGSSTPLSEPGSQLRAYAEEVRELERMGRLEVSISDLTQSRNRATASLEQCTKDLDSEQRDCEQARIRFDHHFEQSPSSSHTRIWRSEIKADRDALAQAQRSDDQVVALWHAAKDDIAVLAGPRDSLEAHFASALASAEGSAGSAGTINLLDMNDEEEEDPQMRQNVQVISEAIHKCHKIRKERSDTLSDLKERIHNDDISQLLIINRRSQNIEPSIFAAELEKFRPHQARIGAAVHAQQAAVETIQRTFAAIVSGKQGREIQNRFSKVERTRKELATRFKRAYDAYKEIRTGVVKGAEFYQELNAMLARLRSQVGQFVSSRASERASMVAAAEVHQRRQSQSNNASSSLVSAFGSVKLSSQPPHRSSQDSQYNSTQSSGSTSPPNLSQYQSSAASWQPLPPSNAYGVPSNPSLPPKPPTHGNTLQRPYGNGSGPASSGIPPPSDLLSYGSSYLPPPSQQPQYQSTSGYAAPPLRQQSMSPSATSHHQPYSQTYAQPHVSQGYGQQYQQAPQTSQQSLYGQPAAPTSYRPLPGSEPSQSPIYRTQPQPNNPYQYRY